ncbi:MAG: deoxyribonuclease IV [Candidatus Acidiferrales bacterium]
MIEDNNRTRFDYDAADEYRPEAPPPPEIAAWKDGSIRIGIHTSIAGDIAGALDLAHGLGANALQIFSSSPRTWGHGTWRIADADAQRFRGRRRELGLGPLVIHANYLINLGSPNRVLRTRSVQAFHQEIVRALALGADFLVTHPGSSLGSPVDVTIVEIAQSLKQSVRGLRLGDLQILLENTAGQGSAVGSKFSELRAIMDLTPELKLGICVDTAHTFAAGWDVRTAEGLDEALREIAGTVGLENIAVVHVNDSKTLLGSRVDRHENIGEGKIGLDAFRRILNHPALAGRAFILETPIDRPGDDRRNVAALWSLVGLAVKAAGKDGMKPRPKNVRVQRSVLKVKGAKAAKSRARLTPKTKGK